MAVAEAETVQVAETWIDDTETPVSAFLKLRAAGGGEPCFLLGVGRLRPRRALLVHRLPAAQGRALVIG